MLHPTPAKALASHYGNRGLLAAAALACTHFAAQASEPMPRVPPEKEPAAWQLAGIAAALKDPAPMVQLHALAYCKHKQWVAQLHFPTAQWLKWLAIPNRGMQSLAAGAAAQLGTQMSAAAQRELLRLLKDGNLDVLTKYAFWRSLWKLGGGMIPEAQMETAAFIQKPNPDFILMQDAYDAVGGLGAAMTPATQDSLLTFIQTPGEDSLASLYATEALARAGLGMQPQMRKKMLHLLLDARTPFLLRSTAAEALGRLGAEIPPQALEFLISALRDPADRGGLRSSAATALALLGPRMPPEVQQALLAAYDETPPENANEATRKSHLLFHQSMANALERAGPEMPAAFQQRLVAGFLKSAHAARKERLPVDGPALRALSGVSPQPDPAVIHTLLSEFQDREASRDTLTTISEQFLPDTHWDAQITGHASPKEWFSRFYDYRPSHEGLYYSMGTFQLSGRSSGFKGIVGPNGAPKFQGNIHFSVKDRYNWNKKEGVRIPITKEMLNKYKPADVPVISPSGGQIGVDDSFFLKLKELGLGRDYDIKSEDEPHTYLFEEGSPPTLIK